MTEMDMAASSRTFRRVAACAVIILCAGAAAWVCNRESCEALWSIVSSASSDSLTDVQQGERIQEKHSPLEVAAAINTGERPLELSPQDRLNARVDAALEEARPMEGGPGVSAALTSKEAEPEPKKQDPVVTGAFVEDLAFWLASSYVPAADGKRGTSAVTLKRANARYSTSGTLRSTESDTFKARKAILRYVCSPGMLEALYRLYAPEFLDQLDKAARLPRRSGTLSDAQTADMFRVYAGLLRRTAVALEAASRTDVVSLAAVIRRADSSEKEANGEFARAYNALAAAREAGDLTQAARQSERMAQSARSAGVFDERKQNARLALAKALRAKAKGATLPDEELVFLGEWLARHRCTPAATSTAAAICARLAGELAARAESVMLKTAPTLPEAAVPSVVQMAAPAPMPVPMTAAAPLMLDQPSAALPVPVNADAVSAGASSVQAEAAVPQP